MSGRKYTGQAARILVSTENPYLFQKIRLELSRIAQVLPFTEELSADAYAVICDTDTVTLPKSRNAITLSASGNADIKLPFARGSLAVRLFGDENTGTAITVLDAERCVLLRGRRIRLTDVEFALFSALYNAYGEFVSREELLNGVWCGERDGGVINVYIHYLREKLETDGERIILSSRKLGYCIDKRYIGGRENA